MGCRLWFSLCCLAFSGAPALALADKDIAKPLPAKVVAAWTKAVAHVGWIGKNLFGDLVFREEAEKGDVPAFWVTAPPEEGWHKLPTVDRPFAIILQADTKNAGLKGLSSLKQLQYLELYSPNVTDLWLKELAALQQLQYLRLIATEVTDAGLKHLTALTQLRSLELIFTQVTDGGLKHLASLKKLQLLDLYMTNVTDAGVKQLQQALPKLRITR